MTKIAIVQGDITKQKVEALAEYFNVPRSSVSITAGLKTRQKIVEITK